MPAKVLVMGDDSRSFLATVRSLGRKGLEVHAAPFNFKAAALRSKYIFKTHELPLYLGGGEEWVVALEELFAREKFAIVIPCDERTLIPLDRHRKRLSTFALLALPNPEAMAVLFDKWETRKLASGLGVPVANGFAMETGDNALDVIAKFGMPIAVKPKSSYSIDSLYNRGRVYIVHDKIGLAKLPAESFDSTFFFESFFEGVGIGVSVLACKGALLQTFEHRRVHELNGTSHYRVSEQVSNAFLASVTKIIASLKYTGIAMFEFRLNDETHEWILLEVNARPWGSLPLPVALGVDFPYRWYELLVHGRKSQPVPYKSGVYGRNVLPDLRYLLTRSGELSRRPLKWIELWLVSIAEYFRVFAGREVYDVWTSDDGAPAWHELRLLFRDLLNFFTSKIPVLTARARQRDIATLQSVLSQSTLGQFKIVFVCQGNICRSPFAAALLERVLFDKGIKIHVQSFGNLPRPGMSSPPFAIAAAKNFDIELQQHRSEVFSRLLADKAGIIVVFDHNNLRWIEEKYCDLKTPVVMLGNFMPGARINPIIADPDGGSMQVFNATYQTISESVGRLAKIIVESQN